jgi:hypothetical protein
MRPALGSTTATCGSAVTVVDNGPTSMSLGCSETVAVGTNRYAPYSPRPSSVTRNTSAIAGAMKRAVERRRFETSPMSYSGGSTLNRPPARGGREPVSAAAGGRPTAGRTCVLVSSVGKSAVGIGAGSAGGTTVAAEAEDAITAAPAAAAGLGSLASAASAASTVACAGTPAAVDRDRTPGSSLTTASRTPRFCDSWASSRKLMRLVDRRDPAGMTSTASPAGTARRRATAPVISSSGSR